MEVPLTGIKRLGLGHTYLNDRSEDKDLVFDILMGADISVYWRPADKGMYEWFSQFNDFEMGNDEKYWIARVWNATMARLGYTEGNPEA